MSPVFINRECPECRGSGRIMMLRTSAPCPTCDGMGSIGEYRETHAEKAEAEVARLQQRVNELLSEKLIDCAVLERIQLRLNMHEVLQQNERLTKMVDWLTNQLYCPSEFTNCAVDCAECRKEAASRAVTAGEVKG